MLKNSPVTADVALAELHARYTAGHPESAALHRAAAGSLPGGNTRTVLHFAPFPLTLTRGEGADVWDVDGHTYVDFVGEFSAGLYGHSEQAIRRAIVAAVDGGIVLAAPTQLERRLADAVTARFPAIARLRFCNSGTEANLMAITTALAVSGRRKILVFREAYHGGVLAFPGGGNRLNVPFDFVFGDYNDIAATAEVTARHGAEIAAVLVEPILGAPGNIPATSAFLHFLRAECTRIGALLIFDEVKTSRMGAGGMQGQLGIAPDMTTLGKYLGGGLSCGAFGGRADIMDHFDPARPDPLRHAGTFNNNVCSMAAGLAGLTEVFTADRASAFLADSEAFRRSLNAEAEAGCAFMQFTGYGSMFSVHFAAEPVISPRQLTPASRRLGSLFHMHCLLHGVLMTGRGDMYASLPMQARHCDALRQAVRSFIAEYADLVRHDIEGASA